MKGEKEGQVSHGACLVCMGMWAGFLLFILQWEARSTNRKPGHTGSETSLSGENERLTDCRCFGDGV